MRHVSLGVAAILAVGAGASSGWAQSQTGFALDRFHPAPAGDRFFGVQGGDVGGHGNVRLMLLADYAWRPLVLYADDGNRRLGSVVSNQLYLHPAASLSLWDRLSISVNVPVAVLTEGEAPSGGGVSFASPNGASLGDVRAGLRLRLVGDPTDAFQLGIGGYVFFPTGDTARFTGEKTVRGLPTLVVNGETSGFVYAVNVGAVVREKEQFAGTQVGSEMLFSAAAGLLVADRKLQIGPELYGTTTFDRAFKRDTTNAEAILGIKLRTGPIVTGAGAGPGLTRGLGTPALRAVLSVAYAPEPEPPVEIPPDRDGDGIIDRDDACPDVPGVKNEDPKKNGCPPDRDGDGIVDADDACPDVPGVKNEDPKKNGCPPDRDGDGIVDADDACPDVPGVKNEDPKKNGCPPDRDGDGIADSEDACPDVPGVKSEDPKRNGCPPDRDGDGINDDVDACPDEKGKPNPDPKKHGCPDVRVTEKEIVILQQVRFKTGSDVILPESDGLLSEVAQVLREHPEILKIEIQGHTDNRGGAAYNKGLSRRRAASVSKWLSKRGDVPPSRLTSNGYGLEQPIADNTTDDGRAQNRRVQFKILEKAQPGTK